MEAAFYCIDCKLKLCGMCNKKIHSKKKRAAHNAIAWSSKLDKQYKLEVTASLLL